MMNINSPVVAILLAGILGSTWAVAGDTLTDGSGTLDLSFRIGGSCAISVEKTSQTFDYLKSDIGNPAIFEGVSLTNHFTITGCQGTPLDFKVSYSTPNPDFRGSGSLCPSSGDCGEKNFFYTLQVLAMDMSGVEGGTEGYPAMYRTVPEEGGTPMTVTPVSDNYTMQVDTYFSSQATHSVMAGHYSGSYTWIFSYK
ncbi:hypothetical protein U2T52_004083 [Salmonella enterica]|nr:hypothetical protein [Salmonella enterica]